MKTHRTKVPVLGASVAAVLAVALVAVAFRGEDSETVQVLGPPAVVTPTTSTAVPVTTVPRVTSPRTPAPKITTTTLRAPTTTARPSTIATPGPTVLRRVLVGDSITAAYGPLVVGATVLGGSGQNPASHPWEAALRVSGTADIVVLQDYVIPGTVGPREDWISAWRSLVAAAHAVAPTVVILVGGPESVFEASLPAALVWMPPADSPDGIHFTPAGSAGLAAIVAALR